MRNRAMDAEDDYVFGPGSRFLVNSPQAVAQAVLTRMRLWTNEWFLNEREGLDVPRILGNRTALTRDWAVQRRILGTPGVKAILSYTSTVEVNGRSFRVSANIDTIYGQVTLDEVL
ncbi:hypothetical protein D3C87_795920 [compost metagenome]